MNSMPPRDERLLAAIAHASVVVTGTGIIVGVIIWLTQKEKSLYASMQAMQAVVYQLIGTLIIMSLWIGYLLVIALATIPFVQNPEANEGSYVLLTMGLMLLPLAITTLWVIYGLWGALQTWRGRDFRYIVIGSRLLEDSNEIVPR